MHKNSSSIGAAPQGRATRECLPVRKSLFLVIAIFMALAASARAQSLSYLPQHSVVQENNFLLAQTQRQSGLPSYAQKFEPSLSSPFPAAYVRVLAATPSVDGRVSEFHPPHILWAWGVSYMPQMSSEYVPEKGWDGCYRETTRIAAAGSPSFSGSTTFLVAGKSASSPASSQYAGVPAALWQNLTVQKGENSTPLLPNLSFIISGHVEMPYRVQQTVCRMQRQQQPGGSSEGCSCTDAPAKTILLRTPELSHSRNWGIELGRPHAVLLLPIAGEQLSYRPKFGAIVFSSHKASQISLLSGGRELNTSYFSLFGVEKGEAGEMQVFSHGIREYGRNFSGKPSIVPADFVSLMRSNSSTVFSNPFPLDALNRSFAYQYYVEASLPFPAGKNSLSAYFLNQFGDEDEMNWSFLVRDASYISIDADGMPAATLVDADAKKYAAPAAPRGVSSPAVQAVFFAGNRSVRPSSAFLPQQQKSIRFDSPLPPALLAFLGALWLFRQGGN